MRKKNKSPVKVSEDNSFRGRWKRYAKVTSTIGGIAGKAVTRRALGQNGTEDRARRAAELRAALGTLKGPLMKVAQMLGTIPDAVPPEYARELQTLSADAPSMGWPFVKRRMASELGPDWQGKFKSFTQEAAAAASLGQVHRAVAWDGRALACKLQYPDMASAMEADLRQLKILLAIFERADRAIATKQIHAEISERLREELDYAREATHIALYHDMLRKESGVHLPEVLPELSTQRLLTMTWLEGERLVEVTARKAGDRNQIAMNMFRIWYVPFYEYGVIHGDPHLGNYTVRKNGSINLLDFGCVRIFPPALVAGVIDLYEALRTRDEDRAAHAYKAWGFKNPKKELIEILNVWARFIYAPLLEDRTRPIEETNNTVYGKETAIKVHRELRRVGGVEVPREFVFMDRAAIGLGGVFLRLKAEINWYQLFQTLISGFAEKNLALRQSRLLKTHGLKGF